MGEEGGRGYWGRGLEAAVEEMILAGEPYEVG